VVWCGADGWVDAPWYLGGEARGEKREDVKTGPDEGVVMVAGPSSLCSQALQALQASPRSMHPIVLPA
jgi:hypothetical protein